MLTAGHKCYFCEWEQEQKSSAFHAWELHCLKKNRTLVKFSNISNKSGPMLIIFGILNRQ